MPAPRIILVRHADTPLNSGDRIRGWWDIPLDQKGLRESSEVGQDLADHEQREGPIQILFSSDLTRALQTAHKIVQQLQHKPPIRQESGLRPWNVGQYTGQPIAKVKGELVDLVKQKTDPAPGGESYAQFLQRFVQTFTAIAQYTRDSQATVCVVTHSRDCRAARALLDGGVQAVMHESASKVLLEKEDPIEPSGHAVITWNGAKWVWDDHSDQIHTPATAPKAGRSEIAV